MKLKTIPGLAIYYTDTDTDTDTDSIFTNMELPAIYVADYIAQMKDELGVDNLL